MRDAPGTEGGPGTAPPATSSGRAWRDWAGLAARPVLGGFILAAGLLKVGDLTGSVQSVVAYQIFPYDVARLIGTTLPVLEIAVGLLLVLGLLTRPSAAVGGALMVAFVAGIASAWARGLSIDCGCFGTGGPVAPGDTRYLSEILRDLGLLALAGWLTVRPRTPFSVDGLLTKGR